MYLTTAAPPTFQESQRGFAWAKNTGIRATGFEEDKGRALDTKIRDRLLVLSS